MIELRVMGVDVEPGCGRHQRCFSVAVLDSDGRLIAKYEHVPLHKLVRIIWEHRPDVLAVDNVYELASDERELMRFVSLLPDTTSIVQVTMTEEGVPVDLRVLANAAGIGVQGKLSPSKTAYVLAQLALRGYGVRVRFLEEKTKIVISRSRSPGKGGSSSDRFQRNLRANILRAVKDVKRVLDKHKLDYDLLFRKSGGGLDSAVFIVYAPRDKLYGLVRPKDDGTVRIEVKPVYTSHLVFERASQSGEEKPRRYLIVGVDPGHVTGVAAVDLSGRVVFVTSRRGLDRHEVVELINKHGVALVVATDVKPAPEYVKKLAAALGAQVFEPPEPLSVDEKRELVARYLPSARLDSHERDALAAAIRAYHYYMDKVKQIETSLSRYDIDIDVARVVASVIRGVTVAEAVENEIARLLYSEEEPGVVVRRVRHGDEQEKPQRDSSDTVKQELERLRAENVHLRQRIRELKARLEEVENEVRVLRNELNVAVEVERRVNMLRHELGIVRSELERVRKEREELARKVKQLMQALMLAGSGSYIVAPVLRSASREELKLVSEVRPRIIFLESPPSTPSSFLSALREAGIKIVIVRADTADALADEASSHGLLVVDDSVTAMVFDGVAVIDLNALSEKLVEAAKRLRKPMEERGLDVSRLKKMLEEYRLQRANELLAQDEYMLEDA